MFCNSVFVSQKVAVQLFKTSYQFQSLFKGNYLSTNVCFRKNGIFLGLIKRGPADIKSINEKLTSFYSTGVCKSEDNLRSIYENDVKQQQKSESIFKEISNGNPEIEKQLKIIEFELTVFGESTNNPFIRIRKEDWELLLQKQSFLSRQKYYKYLWKRTRTLEADKLKKEKKRLEYLMKKEEEGEEEDENQYKISQNALFLRIYARTLVRMMNLRLIDALSFSQHIVFDCSYEAYMSVLNAKFCANQIAMSYAENRMHQAPFHVKLCNVNKNDITIKKLNNLVPGFLDETFLWDIHEESYLDLYDKERLVYLTPDAKQELFEYNHEDVYIIGAFVDRGTGKKVSIAKAKENNLRMAKLPLDFFLNWKQGGKSLPLNHVMKIMLDMRLFNDWNVALKNVRPTAYHPLSKNLS